MFLHYFKCFCLVFVVSCSNKISQDLENKPRFTPPYNYVLMHKIQNTGKYLPMSDEFSEVYAKIMEETDDMSPQYAKEVILLQHSDNTSK